MASGSDTERKAATHIAEVQLTDQGVVPVFKIPTDTTMPPPETDEGTSKEPPVRTMVRSVEPRGLEPLTPTLPVWCATSCATAPCALPGLPGTAKLYTRQPAWSPRGVLAAAPAQLSATSAGK